MTGEVPETPTPPKADPETLVLRGTPGRVVRFRRGAVIAIATLGSTAIVGAAWVALKPATFRVIAGSDDRGDSSARPISSLARMLAATSIRIRSYRRHHHGRSAPAA